MQPITPVTTTQLLASGQEPLAKFEIYVGAAWINLSNLNGKNYLKDFSVSLGGAGMSPMPVTGTFTVVLNNGDSVFYPHHPTSAYKDYLKTGRKARLSIGAKYGGTDYYWQRIIGYMDEPKFDVPGRSVNISCADYMKRLEDFELRSPNNYWGGSQTFDSMASDGIVGSELYNEVDALDINNEANNVTNWGVYCGSFVSFADTGGGSVYVGKATITVVDPPPYILNNNIFTPEANTQYRFQFKYKRTAGTGWGRMRVIIYQNNGTVDVELGKKEGLNKTDYTQEEIWFTSGGTQPIWIQIEWYDIIPDEYQDLEFRIDQFSFFKFVPYWERYYQLPAGCKGIYRVFLDGEDVWQGEEDEGWYYEEATRRVFFDVNKTVANGTSNLIIYYFITQAIEDVLADLLVTGGLYANRAAALADMDYTDPAVDIDQVWFDAGSMGLNAIMKICERCDYRFFFNYDGKPDFNPKPSPGTTAFTFTEQKQISAINSFQDKGEIWNRIVIEGKELAEPISKEEAMPPNLTGEASDAASISTYGERTKTIENHLFQTQASIDNMCSSLLAEYKDPKWYSDIEVPYKPVPIEMGDKISWKEGLSLTVEITQAGIVRDIKINKFHTNYIDEVV